MHKEDMIQLLTQALQLVKVDKSRRDTSPSPLERTSKGQKIMKITNQAFIRRREQYTHGLEGILDARDKQIIIPFNFSIDLSKFETFIEIQKGRFSQLIKDPTLGCKKKASSEYIESIKFTNSQQYDKLLRQIQDLLSNMCENVASITFRLLNQNKLTDNEAKAFASKNFLVNIHSLLIQIKNAVNYFTKQQQIEDIMAKITTQIDQSMMSVLSDLAQHYPQAHPVGQTARMRQIIVSIDQSEDQNFDLICNRDIKIEKYLMLNYGQVTNSYESYTGFIMEVINSAINVTRQYQSADEEVSIFEKFINFSQRLFCTSQNKHFKQVLKENKSKNEKLIDYYEQVLQGQQIETQNYKQLQKDRKKLSPSDALQVIKAQYEESLQKMRQHHKYAIAQKIPNYVKPFGRNHLKTNKFSINNSAILRIMTKWAQNLEQIFKKPQIHIKQRLYSYKTISNQLIAPNKEMNQQLYLKIISQYEIVKRQFSKLKNQNALLQSYILSHNEAGIDSYLKRFTEVRSASSQINASLIEIMHKYLCILIHHLMKAGEKIDTGSSWQNINLVVFRVNDLLRSKFQCNETTFINVLNTLYCLDKSSHMQNKFKLVRVKNKMNQKDNNILINYMFLGRVQCQLQLSIQQMKGKQKNFYNFNHFIYQLTRGKFGAITECAIIVSQHDSTVNSSKDEFYYKPKKYKRKKPVKINYDEQNGIQFKKVHNKDSSLFICQKCKQLMVNHNVDLFDLQENICNTCLIKLPKPEKIIKYQKLRLLLNHKISSEKFKKISNYSEVEKDKYIISLSNTGKNKDSIKLYRVWQHEKQYKLFLLQINKQVITHFKSPHFQYEQFNYIDIKGLKQKKVNMSELTYMFSGDELSQVFPIVSISSQQIEKIDGLLLRFQEYRIQKNLIKSIKFKKQIIDLSNDYKKLNKFEQILQAQINRQYDKIKYTKYKNIEFNSLKKLYLTQLNLLDIPKSIYYLDEIYEINLQNNSIKTIDLTRFIKLKSLNLNKNQLEIIDLNKNQNLLHLTINDNQLYTFQSIKNIKMYSICLENNLLTHVTVSYHHKLDINLNTQRSEKCCVKIIGYKEKQNQCNNKLEAILKQYNQEWRNKNNCVYTFQITYLD